MITIRFQEDILELAKTSGRNYLKVPGKKKACLTLAHDKKRRKAKT